MEKLTEKKEWTMPTVTEFDVTEDTQNLPGDGLDGGAALNNETGGGS